MSWRFPPGFILSSPRGIEFKSFGHSFDVESLSEDLAIRMTLNLDIPESITSSLRLPEPEMEPRLRVELGVALYAQSILPLGKASELAGISRHGFAELLAQRGIPRHYTEHELAQDLEYARG
jgi:predicted HTH domain antitoxin